MSGPDLSDYVEVPERVVQFRARYPEGTLQSHIVRWPGPDFPFVVVEARAYRTPTDPRPGVGLAWENFPGRTPYTKDSELMNAETSAWGRALIAVGAADAKRGIASANEIRRSVGAGGSSAGTGQSGAVADAPTTSRATGDSSSPLAPSSPETPPAGRLTGKEPEGGGTEPAGASGNGQGGVEASPQPEPASPAGEVPPTTEDWNLLWTAFGDKGAVLNAARLRYPGTQHLGQLSSQQMRELVWLRKAGAHLERAKAAAL